METLTQYISFLAGDVPLHDIVKWPPDAFGCVASVLERSGGYLVVVDQWPPNRSGLRSINWEKNIRKLGQQWRKRAALDELPPPVIRKLWRNVLRKGAVEMRSLASLSEGVRLLVEDLVLILAAADEACEGVGIPANERDLFSAKCLDLLRQQRLRDESSTLCRNISAAKLAVLPKLHTPSAGITIRSLSHHLALCSAGEVRSNWLWADYSALGGRHGLNVLIVPWPLNLHPSAFSKAAPHQGKLKNLRTFGFFEYAVRGGGSFDWDMLHTLVTSAKRIAGAVDMIVLPELALTEDDREQLARFLGTLDSLPIFISGLCMGVPERRGMCRNTSITVVPLKSGTAISLSQDKHHRWLLDGSQVQQYGLGGVLDPSINWWEHTQVSRREIAFISLQPWLTLCTLICEDLARPDPIANIVRAVGPNLIIALLMDGPQLSNRWSARYGTVLADDPGSSVLTLSALGMVKLSRPRGTQPSSAVALWKDAHCGSPIELSMGTGQQGILLSLSRKWHCEFTADGRDDEGATAYLTLSGVHPISVDKA